MKTILAGSRTVTDASILERAIFDSGFTITEVVCGGAEGVDFLGARWATYHCVPLKVMPAMWDIYGLSAGPKRNAAMAEYVGSEGGLIAVWNGTSPGTRHMIQIATNKGLKVHVHKV